LRVLAFTAGLAVLSALVSGAAPGLAAVRVPPAGLLSARTLGVRRLPLGRILVIAQLAASVALVAGTGLLLRSVVNLHRVDLGFDAGRLVLFELNAAHAGHPASQLATFYDRINEALAAIPGIRAAAYADQGHMGAGCWNRVVTVPGRPEPDSHSGCMLVSDSFLAALGIPLLRGRSFSSGDGPGSPRVAIVNRAFVDEFFGGEEAVGEGYVAGGQHYRIVGVCRTARYSHIRQTAQPMMYLPYRQAPSPKVWFAVQSVLPPAALEPAVRKIVAGADRNIALAAFTTQRQLSDRVIADERLFASLGGAFGVLAVLLSCIGVYGLMAYHVERRTGEIGIRLALGARREDVSRPILREAAWMGVVGVGLGIPLFWASVRIIRHCLYGVTPYDLPTLVGTASLFLGVAILGAWLPARRASKVHPIEALRHE
jgi:predicted permease